MQRKRIFFDHLQTKRAPSKKGALAFLFNFDDTIIAGTVKLRNAVEAAVLAVGSAVPLFYLPLAFNIRLMIVIAVSVPLGVFGVVGIGGDSLTQFVAHWFRFMKRRRIVTPTPQGNLEANRHRHLRFISKRYRVIYYDDADTLPHNAQVLQRKADRHGKLVKRQTLYDLLPIEKIENGILHTTDDRYIKILEIDLNCSRTGLTFKRLANE